MNKKTTIKSRFTLVELLVAMAIFSILLLVSMQLFSSAQKLWLDSENKNKIYANARTTMEFITSRIQTQAYTENMPFLIGKNKMFFPTAIPMNRKDADGNERDKISMRFIGFSRSEKGILRMHIYSDEGNVRSFLENIPPFPGKKPKPNKTVLQTAYEDVKAKTVDRVNDDYSGEEHNCLELMENVTEFELIPCKLGGEVISGDVKTPPYKLDIKLGITDSDGENTYYFRRSILLNYRGAK